MRKGLTLSYPGQYAALRKLARTDPTIRRPTLPSEQGYAQVVEVQIPDGVAPGEVLQIMVGSTSFSVEVPSSCGAGDTLRVTLPEVEDDASLVPIEAEPEDCPLPPEELPSEPPSLSADADSPPEAREQPEPDQTLQEEPHCCYGRKYIKADDAGSISRQQRRTGPRARRARTTRRGRAPRRERS